MLYSPVGCFDTKCAAYAVRLSDGATLASVAPEAGFALASVAKLPLLFEAVGRLEEGRLGRRQRVRLARRHLCVGSGELHQTRGEGAWVALEELLEAAARRSDNTAVRMTMCGALIDLAGVRHLSRLVSVASLTVCPLCIGRRTAGAAGRAGRCGGQCDVAARRLSTVAWAGRRLRCRSAWAAGGGARAALGADGRGRAAASGATSR